MELVNLVYPLGIIVIALTIDLVFVEPPRKIHPTIWMGRLISLIDGRIPRGNPTREKILGVFLAIFTISIFLLSILLVLTLVKFMLGKIAWMIVAIFLFKSTFAIKDMEKHVTPIIHELMNGHLPGAREQVSRIVGRDVTNLDEPHILSATVESVSESIVDGFFSPFLFFAFLGVPGAIFFRSINTLDSMVGYTTDKHKHVGWFSARLDDFANWLPARISLPFMALASKLLGADWRSCLKVALRDHRKTKSPNGGWPMAAMAGALHVRLEKIGYHTLGEEYPFPRFRETEKAVKIMKVSCLLFTLTLSPVAIFLGIFVQGLIENFLIKLLINALGWGLCCLI
ncbi:MAG: cobalamin biosynthesis protein [Candidatus Jordarchaeaceae archaeon]